MCKWTCRVEGNRQKSYIRITGFSFSDECHYHFITRTWRRMRSRQTNGKRRPPLQQWIEQLHPQHLAANTIEVIGCIHLGWRHSCCHVKSLSSFHVKCCCYARLPLSFVSSLTSKKLAHAAFSKCLRCVKSDTDGFGEKQGMPRTQRTGMKGRKNLHISRFSCNEGGMYVQRCSDLCLPFLHSDGICFNCFLWHNSNIFLVYMLSLDHLKEIAPSTSMYHSFYDCCFQLSFIILQILLFTWRMKKPILLRATTDSTMATGFYLM